MVTRIRITNLQLHIHIIIQLIQQVYDIRKIRNVYIGKTLR